jgi:hypothetical protein
LQQIISRLECFEHAPPQPQAETAEDLSSAEAELGQKSPRSCAGLEKTDADINVLTMSSAVSQSAALEQRENEFMANQAQVKQQVSFQFRLFNLCNI